MWDELARGAVGAIVVADTRRLADSFPAIDFFEDLGVPFIVAVNCFDGRILHAPADVREAIAVDPDVPVELFDARDRATRQARPRDPRRALPGPGAGRSRGRCGRPDLKPAGPSAPCADPTDKALSGNLTTRQMQRRSLARRRGGLVKRYRWLVLLCVVAVVAAACGRRRQGVRLGDLHDRRRRRAARTARPARSARATSSARRAAPSGSPAQGVTPAEIKIGTISDPGFAGRPGLNQELFDTATVFAAVVQRRRRHQRPQDRGRPARRRAHSTSRRG